MKIATFNINNVNERVDNLFAWVRSANPDVVCLQELKSTDREFPKTAIERMRIPISLATSRNAFPPTTARSAGRSNWNISIWIATPAIRRIYSKNGGAFAQMVEFVSAYLGK